MLDVGAVTGVLQEINVDEQTIQSIVDVLETGMEVLEMPLPPLDQSVFGGSQTGGELGRHTDIAQQHVIKAMTDMLAGLEHYRTGVQRYAAEAFEVDGNITAAATRLQTELDAAAPCVSRPDVRDNPVCAVPPAEEG
ncbi:MAG: hypothetical protein Q7J48_14605 [Nocardioides sp.]|nr:hypothetical protein [Nocardioides sp.]